MKEKVKKDYMHIRIDPEFKKNIAAMAIKYGLNMSVLVNVLLHQWYQDKLKEEKQ